jgi:prepilin-type processing-associated H-X9-DG protein
VLFTVLLAAVAAPAAVVALEPAALADDDRSSEIAVGSELMATSDVTLHQAEIAKGSRVSITKILVHGGRIDGVSVALADGHVVKITTAQMHTFFRVVRD